ncbi:hypothetical protein KC959_04260, partial [Candidatus Saccharibacteria bacterium]|nr:hypothetical protein [Candidatus Saccharibacteria bacterium]
MSDMQLVIEQLSSGAAFFRDLEPESQIDFLTKVKLEYDSNPEIPLSGEATQALILSTLGLLRAGVRHTTPTHLDREDLYTYEDAMHDTVATMGSGWLTFVDPNISFGTYFRQRALAVARTKLQREGQNGLRYPSNLNVGKIVRNVYDILEEKKLKLPDSETFRDAVANSGSSNTVIGRNPLEIGRAVFFFRTIDT